MHYRKIKFLLVIVFTICWLLKGYTQSGSSSTYRFLLLPQSSRLAAMGGVMFNRCDDDIQLGLNNPSLISSQMHNQLLLSFVDFPSDVTSFSAAYAHDFKKTGTFTASLQYLDYGKFTETDAAGNTYGEFSAHDMFGQIGWGRKLDSNLFMGANLKLISSSYAEYKSLGIATDVAFTYYNKAKRLALSVIAQNIGTQITSYTDTKESLPFGIHASISQKLKYAPFTYSFVWQHLESWDLTFNDPNDPTIQRDAVTGLVVEKTKMAKFTDKALRHLIFGVEFQPIKAFALRLAYNYQKRQEIKVPSKPGLSGFSWGLGLKISKFQFSYSRAIYHPAGSPNYITIATNLSDFLKK